MSDETHAIAVEWIDILLVPLTADRAAIARRITDAGGVLSWHDEDKPLNAAIGALPGRSKDVRDALMALTANNP